MSKLIAAVIAATFSIGAFAADPAASVTTPSAPAAKEFKKEAPAAKKHHRAKRTKKAEKAV